jgi:chromosome segregation ATPase
MIEPIMIFGIGFLAAALCGLLLLPLVHNRAVRLTKKRLEAAVPLSVAELQADKDHLRAEHAMATRRLELLIEHLKAENAGQFAELGRKSDAINLFKLEVSDKVTEIHALQRGISQLQDHLRATQDDLASKVATLGETERALSDKRAEISKLSGDINEHTLAADSQRVELLALHAQVEALKSQINELRSQINAAQIMETDLRSRLSASAQQETNLRSQLASSSRQEADLRARLAAAHDQEAGLRSQLAGSNQGPDADWVKEQTENAELRERIKDIAAEIARIAMVKEGPNSPIEKLLTLSGNGAAANANANGGHAAAPASTPNAPVRPAGNLGDRIRALQTRMPRPTTNT